MAHIFKKPTKNNKGIIVYTHKELEAPRWKDLTGPLPIVSNRIAERYHIGMHYGAVPRHFGSLHPHVSFVMASKNQVTLGDKNVLHIPMNSRNFLPDFFKPRDTPKYWDILNVSRNHPHKHLDIFIHAVKALYNEGLMYNVLLVVATEPHELEHDSKWPKIVEMYEEMFSMKERDHFTLLRLSPEFSGQGLSMRTIAHFYNSSKVFSMICHAEGESRVIHEALICGLPVVVFKHLQGGGRDYLNENNSVQFDTYERLPHALHEAVQGYDTKLNFDKEKMMNLLGVEKTLESFESYLKDLYRQKGEEYDTSTPLINTDYLNLRLPSHYQEVPWYMADVYKYGADIVTVKQFKEFEKELDL